MKDQQIEPENSQNQGHWTLEEHNRFLQAVFQHGKNWKKIVECIGTRSSSQVRSHAQKYFNKLEKKRPKPMYHSKTDAYMMYLQTMGYQAYLRCMIGMQKVVTQTFVPEKKPVVVVAGECCESDDKKD